MSVAAQRGQSSNDMLNTAPTPPRRIMDCFLADGIEVIFRLALALLLIGKNELLVQDMEGVIRVIRHGMTTCTLELYPTYCLLPVFSKGDAHKVRVRSRNRLQLGVQH